MRELQLTRGQVAIVDDDIFERFSGYKFSAMFCVDRYYAASERLRRETGSCLLHRAILVAPKGMRVDHKNGNSLDDQLSNLRIATHQQNMQNRKKHACKNPFKGVYEKRPGKFTAMIFENGRLKTLGTFSSSEEAARVYDASAEILHGEFARLNFPTPSHPFFTQGAASKRRISPDSLNLSTVSISTTNLRGQHEENIPLYPIPAVPAHDGRIRNQVERLGRSLQGDQPRQRQG